MPRRGCRVCFSCPRALSRTANAAEIARSYWLLPCRGVGDGYRPGSTLVLGGGVRACRFSRFSPAKTFNQSGQTGDRGKRRILLGCIYRRSDLSDSREFLSDYPDIDSLLNWFACDWYFYFVRKSYWLKTECGEGRKRCGNFRVCRDYQYYKNRGEIFRKREFLNWKVGEKISFKSLVEVQVASEKLGNSRLHLKFLDR